MAAEKTGQYIVGVFEPSSVHLLAAHGPYDSAESARTAALKVRSSDRAEVWPLWRCEDVGEE